jgi:hypothetical protein
MSAGPHVARHDTLTSLLHLQDYLDVGKAKHRLSYSCRVLCPTRNYPRYPSDARQEHQNCWVSEHDLSDYSEALCLPVMRRDFTILHLCMLSLDSYFKQQICHVKVWISSRLKVMRRSTKGVELIERSRNPAHDSLVRTLVALGNQIPLIASRKSVPLEMTTSTARSNARLPSVRSGRLCSLRGPSAEHTPPLLDRRLSGLKLLHQYSCVKKVVLSVLLPVLETEPLG